MSFCRKCLDRGLGPTDSRLDQRLERGIQIPNPVVEFAGAPFERNVVQTDDEQR